MFVNNNRARAREIREIREIRERRERRDNERTLDMLKQQLSCVKARLEGADLGDDRHLPMAFFGDGKEAVEAQETKDVETIALLEEKIARVESDLARSNNSDPTPPIDQNSTARTIDPNSTARRSLFA